MEPRRTKLLKRWHAMMSRCHNPKDPDFRRYGGRGISVCERWKTFAHFLEDVGLPPENKTLDRIDNDRGYEPGNVRWATQKEQNYNRSDNIKLTHDNKTLNLWEWAQATGIKTKRIYHRIFTEGWSVADALTKPVRGYRRKAS